MKRIYVVINVLIMSLLVVLACKTEDPVLPLIADSFDNKAVLLLPKAKYTLEFNNEVRWYIKGQQGKVSADASKTLSCTAPDSIGTYKLIAKHAHKSEDSLTITLIVTPHAETLNNMRKGGYVLAFHHTEAIGNDRYIPTPTDSVKLKLLNNRDKNWYTSCSDTLAKQLSKQGRADAKNIGKLLTLAKIPISKVTTSQFCRCKMTADSMNLASVSVAQDSTMNYWMSKGLNAVDKIINSYENLTKAINKQPIDSNNYMLVFQSGLGSPPTPAPLNDLKEGDVAIFKLDKNATTSVTSGSYVITIKLKELLVLVK